MAKNRKPWSWVPSLYFAQGLPYMLTIVVSTVMYKNFGLSNSDITLYTGWLYLPWVIKPFWSPFIDNLKTKRFWIVATQLVIGAGFAAIGLTIPLEKNIQWTLIAFWLIAFSSATHDIAADGFYMLGLKEYQQSYFVGIRNTFWRVASIAAQGGLVYLSGILAGEKQNFEKAWSWVFIITAIVFLSITLYHKLFLPEPINDPEKYLKNGKEAIVSYFNTFADFFKKKQIIIFIFFVLFYRLGEAQLTKLATPFLIDSKEAGGLALTNEQVGWAYGTIGVLGLILGGILGGILISKHGLKFWIWPMALSMKLPDLVYILMAHYQPGNFILIQFYIAIEQFGYGFGFTAFTLYLIYFVRGEHKTSHYAFATGIMALAMMVPGMLSGWIQEHLNYEKFFIWVMLCTIPGLILIPFLKIEKSFGRKNKKHPL